MADKYEILVSEKLEELIDLCTRAHMDPEYDPIAYMLSQAGESKFKDQFKKPEGWGKSATLLGLANILMDLKNQLEESKEGEPYDFKIQVACDRRDPMGVEPFWATACMDKEVMKELMEDDYENLYMAGKEIQTIPLK